MPEKQLRLLDPPRPLAERLGEGFFRSLPKSAGVYLMHDSAGRILYVGQSGNLRQRLLSYKNATPENASRKVIRLVHQTAQITWESCADAPAARLRENQLLRLHQPRFNVMNTWPQAHYFIHLAQGAETLDLVYSRQETHRDFVAHGAFKSATLLGYAALLRLCWLAWHGHAGPDALPRRLLLERVPRSFSLEGTPTMGSRAELTNQLSAFLAGASEEIVSGFKERFPVPETPGFARSWWLNEFELLEGFYARGPGRNHNLRQANGVQSPTIPQAALDDFLALAVQGRLPSVQKNAT